VPARSLAALAAVYVLVLGGLRLTVAAPERCGDVTTADMRAAALDGARWLSRNQDADGSYLYDYSPARGALDEYNAVRHAGATLALYQAARLDRRFLTPADRGLQWMRNRLVVRDDWAALPDGATWAPLGGDALMLAALAERRALTADDRYDATMRDLGRFIVALQRRDGGFYIAYDLVANDVVREGTSPYYPGEATWALARLANALPHEPEWRRPAMRGATFIGVQRDAVEGVDFPPLNDHWGAYAFAEMARWPLSDAQADYAELLYGRFHLLLRSQAQRDNGGLYSVTHSLYRRGAAVGTWVEGLGALARLARVDARLRDRRDAIDAAATCGAGVLARRQSHDRTNPRVDGAWYADDATRVDDQQHPISGLLAVAALADRRS
jgi:hypothetical protein